MPLKTLSDCAECPVVGMCSAHVTDGEWEHDEGVDPCVVVIAPAGWTEVE